MIFNGEVNVVSYRNSTSNHNWKSFIVCNLVVVSYRNSTSNHNRSANRKQAAKSCILSKFYIKPQLVDDKECRRNRCILSKFYIKPQLQSWKFISPDVVSYRNSTSNHNLSETIMVIRRLYLIEILHQTTTKRVANSLDLALYLIEILHQTTTLQKLLRKQAGLYLIEILHQTTTF